MRLISNRPKKQRNVAISQLPTDGAPEDFRRSTEMDRAMRRLSVHALTEEPMELHLLANKATRET